MVCTMEYHCCLGLDHLPNEHLRIPRCDLQALPRFHVWGVQEFPPHPVGWTLHLQRPALSAATSITSPWTLHILLGLTRSRMQPFFSDKSFLPRANPHITGSKNFIPSRTHYVPATVQSILHFVSLIDLFIQHIYCVYLPCAIAPQRNSKPKKSHPHKTYILGRDTQLKKKKSQQSHMF